VPLARLHPGSKAISRGEIFFEDRETTSKKRKSGLLQKVWVETEGASQWEAAWAKGLSISEWAEKLA
jgi:hypothetical protein